MFVPSISDCKAQSAAQRSSSSRLWVRLIVRGLFQLLSNGIMRVQSACTQPGI